MVKRKLLENDQQSNFTNPFSLMEKMPRQLAKNLANHYEICCEAHV